MQLLSVSDEKLHTAAASLHRRATTYEEFQACNIMHAFRLWCVCVDCNYAKTPGLILSIYLIYSILSNDCRPALAHAACNMYRGRRRQQKRPATGNAEWWRWKPS